MKELSCVVTNPSVEIAERDDYLEVTNLVCYYNYPNLNGVALLYGESKEAQKRALKKAQTLKMMPVQAKYLTTLDGEPTLGGHEAKMVKGKVQFGTASIGVHEDVWIENEDVECPDGEVRNLPCLYAKARIWKRYEKCVEAVKRLFSMGQLKTSWEINTTRYEFKDGIKYLLDYSFIGNALLNGETNPPAYPNASILEVSAQEPCCEMMVAEALAIDIDRLKESEVSAMPNEKENFDVEISEEEEAKKCKPEMEDPDDDDIEDEEEEDAKCKKKEEGECKKKPCAEEETSTDDDPPVDGNDEGDDEPEEEEEEEEEETVPDDDGEDEEKKKATAEIESSMLTVHDLNCKIAKALEGYNEKFRYAYVCFNFPADGVCWVKAAGDKAELEFTEVVYSVNGDEVLVVSDSPVKLVASPREVNRMLSERDVEIGKLKGEIAELSKVKARYDEELAEKKKAEHEKAVSELKEYASMSGYFSEEEMAGKEMRDLFEALDRNGVKAMIADRVMEGRKAAGRETEISSVGLKANLSYEKEEIARKRSEQWNKFMGY